MSGIMEDDHALNYSREVSDKYAEADQQRRSSFERVPGNGTFSRYLGRQPDHRCDDLLILPGDPR